MEHDQLAGLDRILKVRSYLLIFKLNLGFDAPTIRPDFLQINEMSFWIKNLSLRIISINFWIKLRNMIFMRIKIWGFLKFFRIEISDGSGGFLSSGWAFGSISPDDWGRMWDDYSDKFWVIGFWILAILLSLCYHHCSKRWIIHSIQSTYILRHSYKFLTYYWSRFSSLVSPGMLK